MQFDRRGAIDVAGGIRPRTSSTLGFFNPALCISLAMAFVIVVARSSADSVNGRPEGRSDGRVICVSHHISNARTMFQHEHARRILDLNAAFLIPCTLVFSNEYLPAPHCFVSCCYT